MNEPIGNENDPAKRNERHPHRVRLPGFIIEEEEIGLGDVIKRVTSAIGIQPCGGCDQRAAILAAGCFLHPNSIVRYRHFGGGNSYDVKLSDRPVGRSE